MSTRKNGLYVIKNKVIEQKELQQLAKLIWKEYQPRHISARDKEFSVYVKCFENVTYRSDTIKIFDTDSEIYKERIKSIEILAQCDNSLYIKLRLNHGQLNYDDKFFSDSDIEIGGDNFEKIHDIQARFRAEIKSIQEQHNFFIKNDKYISPTVFILATITFGFFIDLIITKTSTPYWRNAVVDWSNFIGYTGGAAFIGWMCVYLYQNFVNKSVDYYPIVELRLGPEHLRPEVRQRKYLINFFTLVIAPLVLAVVYDLIKIVLYIKK